MLRLPKLTCAALITLSIAGCAESADSSDGTMAGAAGMMAAGGETSGGGESSGGESSGGMPGVTGGSGGSETGGAGVNGTGGSTSGESSGTWAGDDGGLAGSGGTGPTPVDPTALEALPGCSGTVTELFSEEAIEPPATGSGIYNPADPAKREALDRSIRTLIGGDVPSAQSAAEAAGYEACRVDDGGTLVVVWKPLVTGEGHAVLAWRTQGAVPLIVEAPHAFHDNDTELEATEMFVQLKARALIVSGIYRCSSLTASGCDGVTTACVGVPIPYTISDAAHNAEMFFQTAHIALSESFAEDSIANMHGFQGPGISVSNGTEASPSLTSLHVRLIEELAIALPGETITSCQEYPGATYGNRMCGGENVQGRYTNGSSDACTQSATSTSNRFVHVEQSQAVRDQRAQVIAAFAKALE